MRLIETDISGCLEIQPLVHHDLRGSFVKNFHQEQFAALGLETYFPEEFYSKSLAGVLRGMHFVAPPRDQVKLVTCVYGQVLDAVVDLRWGSPTFGQHYLTELSADRGNMLYIDKGMAHGFYVPRGEAILLYRVSTMYSAAHDKGIRWDSAGIAWPTKSPIVSDRDAALPSFDAFETPLNLSGN